MQEVLSATQQHGPSRPTRGAAAIQAPSAFIPTPDSTGIVDNYEELYPSTRWKDPATYVCTSQIVEEAITNGLANGFTYYIDERDKEWLDKNNEEARGEGTSAQGAISVSSIRTSARSAKVKGKEPESSLPIVISEDEFELVMGLFEKVTHERTEFLHHVRSPHLHLSTSKNLFNSEFRRGNGVPRIFRLSGCLCFSVDISGFCNLHCTRVDTSAGDTPSDSARYLSLLEGASY